MKVSFCLITLNEESNLPRCLDSIRGLADEIIVLDSGSTDGTARVAAAHGARFLHQDWRGYVEQKNRVLSLASHEWVFSLDADEALSPALREEVARTKALPEDPGCSGFSMRRCVLYQGRWIRHGDWYPDRLVRLFRRSRARFEGVKVHERLVLEGEVRRLGGEIEHYSFRDVPDHRARCEKYARLWAESRQEMGHTASALSPYTHAAFRWIRGFLLRRGFMDGAIGLRIANACAWEVFLKYRLLHRATRRRRG